MISNKIKFTEIPKYPEVRRDLALLIDHNVTYDSIYSIAKQTEKSLLKVNLFDVYEGSNLPDGKIICIKFYHTGPF
jgi:phenylalanyl-tRNA synthetase beta chain